MKWGVRAVVLGAAISMSSTFAQSYTTNVFASESLMYADESDAFNRANDMGVAGWAYDGNYFKPPYPYAVRTLLRFNIPSAKQMQVSQAILHFQAVSINHPNDPSFIPNYVSDDSWSDATTWATQPAFTPLSGYGLNLSGPGSHLITAPAPSYSEHTADVTEFFTNNPTTEGQGQTMSVLMQGTETNGGRWYYFYARNGVDLVGATNANAYLELIFVP